MSETAHQRFVEMIRKPEPEIDLAHAALLIAQEEHSDLCPEAYLEQLDRWASDLLPQLQHASAPEHYVSQLNRFLFGELGFRGNRDNYYDPRNSFLDWVIDNRSGIPISLSVIYIELAKRIGLTVFGVGMPGHFLVKPASRKAAYYIDPFEGGRILNEEDCSEKIVALYGDSLQFQKSFLAPVDKRHILTRILYNLKNIYVQANDHSRALSVVDKLLHLSPEAPSELRDRGILNYRLGRHQEAVIDLQKYLLYVPGATDAGEIRKMILMLQTRLRNQLPDLQ